MARALGLEEAQVMLSLDAQKIDTRATEVQRLDISRHQDRLQSQINRKLVQSAITFLGDAFDAESIALDQTGIDNDPKDIFNTIPCGSVEAVVLLLPSYIGLEKCQELGLDSLVEQEVHLRQGQSNDALHEIHLALADKAVLFQTDVRHSRNYNMTSWAWKKVAATDATVKRYAMVYCRCRQQMVALGAEPTILDHYQTLDKKDLIVSTTVSDPNARGHWYDSLAWFWTMDIPKDTNTNDWMSECTFFVQQVSVQTKYYT